MEKNINNVLAANLAHFMSERKLTQAALAKSAGIGQTTVSLYLDPSRRQPGKSGKAGSAKLSEVEQLANALEVDAWQLLRPFTPEQRRAYEQIELAFRSLHNNVTASPEAPAATAATGTNNRHK